jgi:hypothetical protein
MSIRYKSRREHTRHPHQPLQEFQERSQQLEPGIQQPEHREQPTTRQILRATAILGLGMVLTPGSIHQFDSNSNANHIYTGLQGVSTVMVVVLALRTDTALPSLIQIIYGSVLTSHSLAVYFDNH